MQFLDNIKRLSFMLEEVNIYVSASQQLEISGN